MNQRKLGVLLSYINIIVVILSQLLYTPIMLNVLGQSEFGIYSLSQSLIFYLSLLNFGLLGSYFKFYSEYKAKYDEIKRLNAMYVIIVIILSVILYFLGLKLADNINSLVSYNFVNSEKVLVQSLLKIMLVTMVVMIFNNLFYVILSAREEFIFCKSIDLIKNIATPLFSLPVILVGLGSKGIAYVLLVVTIIIFFINIKYMLVDFKIVFLFKNINFKKLRQIYKFSVFMLLWGLIDQFNLHSGKLILANFFDAKAISVYTIGVQFCILFAIFSDAILCVFTPKIYDLVYEQDSNKKLTDLMIKIGRLQCYIVCFIWIGFAIFGKKFIELWAGKEYLEAYWVSILIMSSLIICLIQNTGVEILKAYNKYKSRIIAHIIIFLISILISIKLVSIYGIIGCALGSSFFIIFSNILVANYFYIVTINLEIKRFFLEILNIFPAIALSALIGLIITKFLSITNFTELFFYGFIFSIAYFLLVKKFAFNDYEKELLLKIKNKILN